MIRALIVENEKAQIKKLTGLLEGYFPEVEVLDTCETVPYAVAQVKKLNPDLIFLDVELPPDTGFDLLTATPDQKYRVIFTTSHSEYAARAIRFSALDYLLKPFNETELRVALDRYQQYEKADSQAGQIQSLLRNLKQSEFNELEIYLPVKNGKHRLRLGSIICITSQDGKICFYVKEQEPVVISKTLSWAEDLLSDFRFFRTSDAYLINLSHVEKVENVREGAVVTLSGGYEAEVSRRKKSKFLDLILENNILKIR